MTPFSAERGAMLASLLTAVVQDDMLAARHDHAAGDRDHHAAMAQDADERAQAGRRAARALIEQSFPGVSWSMIERAAL